MDEGEGSHCGRETFFVSCLPTRATISFFASFIFLSQLVNIKGPQEQFCMNAKQLPQVATWHRMGEQMGGEQSEGPPMHHPHMPPHGVTAESELRNMATMHIRLEELQRRCAHQQEVRNLAIHVLCLYSITSRGPAVLMHAQCGHGSQGELTPLLLTSKGNVYL